MAVIDDSNPELGGNLNLNGYAVTDYVNGAMRFGNSPFEDTGIITTATGAVMFAGTTTGAIFGPSPDIAVIRHCVSKGSLTSPANTEPGDFLGAWNVSGYYNGNWKTATALMSRWSDKADMDAAQPASQIALVSGNNANGMNWAIFDENGVFTAPVFSATSFTTTLLPVNPSAGWMVFDETTKQFKGYNGTDWVVLG